MTAPKAMDRARLAAFVDGELSPEDSAAVVMHLADHPADQAYVDDLFAANAALARAFAAPLSEPVPPAIQALLAEPAPSAAILPFPPARGRLRPALAGGLGLAAGLALALYLVQPAPPATLAVGPLDAASPLATALEGLPSGATLATTSGPEAVILSTLPTATGHCREVESLDRAARRIDLALACRLPQGGWQIEMVLAETLPGDSTTEPGFAAAEGTALQDFSAYLDRRGAGLALSPEEEAALIARGWAE
ncbi:zf-HC2 domain-containing protein [Rhodobacter sp. HX-7-19]|uniref:Zf-HC2 domain-containing protein n=1 Tax=Paragemmobacter kunshanensis TaxID=2583234 RepID=A0A6M1UAQ9_9RHOB|nr:zf-HC2 domain-containing protein [Rhodobacter kunshanensis]NGQ93033.1 zf-HC2 domain-containing protein [Rhodobacter kunshanensis]